MKITVLKIIWITIGLFYLTYGLYWFISYANPHVLWLVMILDPICLKYVILGSYFLTCGFKINNKSDSLRTFLLSLPLIIIFNSIYWLIYTQLKYGDFYGLFNYIIDYPIIILVFFTLKQTIDSTSKIYNLINEKKILIIKNTVIFGLIPFLLTLLIKYEHFRFIYK